jgi:hypothetical protein
MHGVMESSRNLTYGEQETFSIRIPAILAADSAQEAQGLSNQGSYGCPLLGDFSGRPFSSGAASRSDPAKRLFLSLCKYLEQSSSNFHGPIIYLCLSFLT